MKYAYTLVAAVLLAIGSAPAWAAPPVTYVRLSCGQGDRSTVFLRFENNRMKMAPTLAALEKAPPLRAKDGRLQSHGRDSSSQTYSFPGLDLPLTVAGATKVTADLSYSRYRYKAPRQAAVEEYVGVNGTLVVVVRDDQGTNWGYSFNVYTRGEDGNKGADPKRPLRASVPALDLSKLSFEIAPQVEGRNAAIGVQVKAGRTDVHNVLKNGKSTLVTMQITGQDGSVVKSEKGDPLKFGFT